MPTLAEIRTDDHDGRQYITDEDLAYLVDVAKPRSIQYEQDTIRRLFAIRHKRPWYCGTPKSDIGCHVRICRRLTRELAELKAEQSRRLDAIDDHYRQSAGGRY